MSWLVDHPGQRPEDRRAYDTAQQADRAVLRLRHKGHALAVAWFCTVDEAAPCPEAVVIAHRDANDGGVGSKVIRKILGRQIEDSEAS